MSQPTARTRSRRSRRRAELLEHAARLAQDRGGPTFTTEELARAADVSQASLFYYFRGGRQEIETALALRESWSLFDRIRAAAAAAPDGVTALAAMLRTTEAALAEDSHHVMSFMERMLKGPWPAELIAEHVQAINAMITAVVDRLEHDRRAGKLAPEIENLRRYTMMVVSIAIGQIVQQMMIEASGGTSLHERGALFDDLVGVVERGTRWSGRRGRRSIASRRDRGRA